MVEITIIVSDYDLDKLKLKFNEKFNEIATSMNYVVLLSMFFSNNYEFGFKIQNKYGIRHEIVKYKYYTDNGIEFLWIKNKKFIELVLEL